MLMSGITVDELPKTWLASEMRLVATMRGRGIAWFWKLRVYLMLDHKRPWLCGSEVSKKFSSFVWLKNWWRREVSRRRDLLARQDDLRA